MAKSQFSLPADSQPAWAYLLGSRNRVDERGDVVSRQFSADDDALLRKITSKHFPAGFTIVDQAGNWRSGDSVVSEDSRTVIVVGGTDKKHTAWRNELAAKLQQETVIRIELGRGTFFHSNPSKLAAIPKNKA